MQYEWFIHDVYVCLWDYRSRYIVVVVVVPMIYSIRVSGFFAVICWLMCMTVWFCGWTCAKIADRYVFEQAHVVGVVALVFCLFGCQNNSYGGYNILRWKLVSFKIRWSNFFEKAESIAIIGGSTVRSLLWCRTLFNGPPSRLTGFQFSLSTSEKTTVHLNGSSLILDMRAYGINRFIHIKQMVIYISTGSMKPSTISSFANRSAILNWMPATWQREEYTTRQCRSTQDVRWKCWDTWS